MAVTKALVKKLILKYIGGSPVKQATTVYADNTKVVIKNVGGFLGSIQSTLSGIQSLANNVQSLVNNPLGAISSSIAGNLGGLTDGLNTLVGSNIINSTELTNIMSAVTDATDVLSDLTASASMILSTVEDITGNAVLGGLTDIVDLASRYESLAGSAYDVSGIMGPISSETVGQQLLDLVNDGPTLIQNGLSATDYIQQVTTLKTTYEATINNATTEYTNLKTQVASLEGAQAMVDTFIQETDSQAVQIVKTYGAFDENVFNAVTEAIPEET